MLDIECIRRISKEKRIENKAFVAYLNDGDSDKVDNIVHRLYEKVASQIDCVMCGNCCRNIRPPVKDEVLQLYLTKEDLSKYKYAWGFTCKNLDGNKCKIYTDRYDECRLFPYLDQNNFISRMPGVLQNYEICPIVFNVVEQLKVELNWKYDLHAL